MILVSDTSVLLDLERELKPFGGNDLRQRGLRVEASTVTVSSGCSIACSTKPLSAQMTCTRVFKRSAFILAAGCRKPRFEGDSLAATHDPGL